LRRWLLRATSRRQTQYLCARRHSVADRVCFQAGKEVLGLGGRPLPRMLMKRLSVSNQKGAPSVQARAVISQPKGASNTRDRSGFPFSFLKYSIWVLPQPMGMPVEFIVAKEFSNLSNLAITSADCCAGAWVWLSSVLPLESPA